MQEDWGKGVLFGEWIKVGVLGRWKRAVGILEEMVETVGWHLEFHGATRRVGPEYEVVMRGIKESIAEAEDIINYVCKKKKKNPIYRIKHVHSAFMLIQKFQGFFNKITYGNLGSLERPLATTTGDVPLHLWLLIYYFLLFPADFQLPTRRLLALWSAEPFITLNFNSRNAPYFTLGELLNMLIHLGVVVVKKKKINGEVQACSLKPGTRDKWLEEAHKAHFFKSRTGVARRVVHHASDSFNISNYGNVGLFVSLDTREGSKPGEDIGDLLHKCILGGRFEWLKSLDLEGVFRPKLPNSLSKLTRLEYLGLRWTYLQHLPDFVNKFLELQVLDVKHTYISVLPTSIWRMMYLQHLYLSEAYRTRFPPRPPLPEHSSLFFLETLWGALIDEDTNVEGGLDTSTKIHKLGLSCTPASSSEISKQLKAVNKWISTLRNLKYLRLKSRDKEGEPSHLHLTTLENNTDLSTLYLLGRLDPDVVATFPQNLTDITLSASQLEKDPMESLGDLPNLQILRLLAHSLLCPAIRCSRQGFPQLKVVYIWNLEKLEEWQLERGSMPRLEEFEIRSCCNLKMLPHQLNNLEQLERFRLTSMHQEFMEKTKKSLPDLWAKLQSM